MTERPPTFGTLLRRYRAAAGLSQDELAERAGLSARAISDLERGARRAPYRDTIERLARALALSDADAAALNAAIDRRRHIRPHDPVGGTRGNVPLPGTRLIGRERAVEALTALLCQPTVRLLTLTGPGGVGKTRLALAVAGALADAFPDGAYFVPLAGISDPALVSVGIALALGLREPPQRQAVFDLLAVSLGRKKVLLVLDNCEHLLEAAPLVARLLALCPDVRVLATSRAPLNLSAEQEWPVPPLALPDDAPHLPLRAAAASPAVALFVERAARTAPEFALTRANMPAIVAICRRLDGLPLAIELAAPRVKLLPPQAMLARMTDRLGLLTGGPRDLPARHQTMRDAIRWSYDLLTADERQLLARLAVFANGWTVEAAEAVCGGQSSVAMLDVLQSLLDQSLVTRAGDAESEPRFRMLETIRAFALEQLMATGEAEAMYRTHTAYCVALAERAEIGLAGPEQRTWLMRLEDDHDNLRAVLRRTLGQNECAIGLRLAGAVWRFWHLHGHLSEGRQWLDSLLAKSEGCPAVPNALRAKALIGAGNLALYQADYPAATARYEEGITLCDESGDIRGSARMLGSLGLVAQHQGRFAVATTLYEQCLELFRRIGDRAGIANTLNNLAVMVRAQGEYARARSLHEEGLALQQTLGDVRGVAQALSNLGVLALYEDDLARAVALLEHSLTLQRQLDAPRAIAYSLASLGWVVLQQGDPPRATELFKQSLTLQRDVGDRAGIAECVEGIAGVAALGGEPEVAAQLLSAAAGERAVIAAPVTVSNQGMFVERLRETLRASLETDGFERAAKAGAALSLEEAMAAALRFAPGRSEEGMAPLRMVRGARR